MPTFLARRVGSPIGSQKSVNLIGDVFEIRIGKLEDRLAPDFEWAYFHPSRNSTLMADDVAQALDFYHSPQPGTLRIAVRSYDNPFDPIQHDVYIPITSVKVSSTLPSGYLEIGEEVLRDHFDFDPECRTLVVNETEIQLIAFRDERDNDRCYDRTQVGTVSAYP